jgi:PAS domain S-box-containing protein
MLDTIATVDFGLAFHRGPEATLLLLGDSPHFTIVAASDAFLTATGKYRHEIVGLHFFQLVNNNSEARRSLMGWFDPKNQTRPIVPLTFACEKPFLQYQLSPLVDESGFILNAVCQFKKGSIDDYYRLLVDSIKDHAFFLIDQHGTILSWNIGADKMKGYAASEVIGKHFSMFYVSDDIKNDKPRRDLEQALKSGGLQEEGYQLRKDGTKFWANIAISPIFSNDTELSAFCKAFFCSDF